MSFAVAAYLFQCLDTCLRRSRWHASHTLVEARGVERVVALALALNEISYTLASASRARLPKFARFAGK